MDSRIPNSFKTIGGFCFEDNKIILDSQAGKKARILRIFLESLLFLPFVIIVLSAGLDIRFVMNFLNAINANYRPFLFFIFGCWFVIMRIILSSAITHVVIDCNKNYIYTELILMKLIVFRSDKIYREDIIQVGNNVKYFENNGKGWSKTELYDSAPGCEIHPKTHYIHEYKVCFLLKNGEMINYAVLGRTMEDYDKSIKLAKAISEFWHIPLITCRDNCYLTVVDTHSGYDTRYKFSFEEIEPYAFFSIRNFLEIPTAFFKFFFIVLGFLFLAFVSVYTIDVCKSKQGILVRLSRDFKIFQRDIQKLINKK
ncbi:MAG: hypothetical protein J6Z11_01870 [Candidatus Riflebacteria bacterium]|nr:hypothetical protein [Candidatus Riflebacteria bacterium]